MNMVRVSTLAVFLFPLVCHTGGSPPLTTVTVTATTTSLHSSQTSSITATITQRTPGMPAGGGVAPPPSTVNFAASLGSMRLTSRSSGTAGTATSTFTAPAVDRDTPVTITATYGSTTGSRRVIVKPAESTAPFGTSTTTGDDVTVSPSVTEDANGWVFTYIIQEGSWVRNISTVSVNFQEEVRLTVDPVLTVRPSSRSQNFLVTVNRAGPITITARDDVEPGGTATWDIVKLDPGGVGPVHANITTTGPQ